MQAYDSGHVAVHIAYVATVIGQGGVDTRFESVPMVVHRIWKRVAAGSHNIHLGIVAQHVHYALQVVTVALPLRIRGEGIRFFGHGFDIAYVYVVHRVVGARILEFEHRAHDDEHGPHHNGHNGQFHHHPYVAAPFVAHLLYEFAFHCRFLIC